MGGPVGTVAEAAWRRCRSEGTVIAPTGRAEQVLESRDSPAGKERALRKIIGLTAIVAAFAIGMTAAFALVTFDPSTGTGFVGKGDVQTAFGWNNKQLQNNAS